MSFVNNKKSIYIFIYELLLLRMMFSKDNEKKKWEFAGEKWLVAKRSFSLIIIIFKMTSLVGVYNIMISMSIMYFVVF